MTTTSKSGAGRWIGSISAAVLLAACSTSSDDRDRGSADDGRTHAVDDDGAVEAGGTDEDTGATGGEGEGAGDDESALRLDIPPASDLPNGGDGTESGCAKIDFLFVIDNSGSMMTKQRNLVNNFPGFISAITDTLEFEDFHIMVVDTDAGGNPACNPQCQPWTSDPWNFEPCPFPSAPCTDGGHTQEALDLINARTECDYTLGAGVTTPIGSFSSNQVCDYADGKRWFDGMEADLGESFTCAAQVGIGGAAGEKQAEALIAALSDDLNAPGGCNEGFLRDDALLVITLITDEPDNSSDPRRDPNAWKLAIEAAKGGREENIVMLGLLEDFSQDLILMVEAFTNSARGNVKDDNYQAFFEEAVGFIDNACEDFMPPG